MVRILVYAIVLGLPTIVFGQPRVATPTFSVGGGEYTTVIMVVVRVSTPGATIRFTQNGSDPTEFDPVIVSGSRIAINTSQTLKARAWKTGSRPSAVRAETYQMVSVAAGPPIGVGDAAAGGAQSILARPDGRVLAWKSDATPMPVDDLAGVTSVAAGAALLSVAGQFPDASRWLPIDGNRQGQGRVRNPGIGIFLKSHWAFAGLSTFRHFSIRIVPSAQAFWQKADPSGFLPEDVYGNRFMSFGAGTGPDDTHLGCSGTLNKGKNRDRDVIEKPSSLDQYPVLPSNENEVIWSLIEKFGKYANNLPYACLPESNPGYYNSHSFARSLQDAVGLPIPAPRPNLLAPGWFTPAAARYFGVGQ